MSTTQAVKEEALEVYKDSYRTLLREIARADGCLSMVLPHLHTSGKDELYLEALKMRDECRHISDKWPNSPPETDLIELTDKITLLRGDIDGIRAFLATNFVVSSLSRETREELQKLVSLMRKALGGISC